MTTIVLASGNAKKLRELEQLLSGKGLELKSQREFDIPDAVEDGSSFVDNALIKARHASRLSGLPALADDSGLEVDALNGAPGIHSARYASGPNEGNSSDAANNALLLARLTGLPSNRRKARFKCVVVLVRNFDDPDPLICEGSWEGRILVNPAGHNGFGYDPLFYVPSHRCSSAELDPAIKNSISHRGQALRELLARWPELPG